MQRSVEGLQIGRFRIERLIGRGGMSEVYFAKDDRIQQQVAVKVLQTEKSLYPTKNVAHEAERFRQEASAIANLRHHNIVPLYDYNEISIDHSSITYLVMPYYKDGSFVDWLRQRGSDLLPVEDVVYYIQQSANALQFAHDHQIIHRDVKPSNFLIDSSENSIRPNLLLADFGISKFGTTARSGTESIGTVTYMAPEQWNGRPTYASDQYSLAIMTYELLVGRPPFEGPPNDVIRQHQQDQPQLPSALNPRLPRTIDMVLLRALDKRPENRYPSITEFASALRQSISAINNSDIRATLQISSAQALQGTNRTVTLPGGRKLNISVPSNAHDGQILKFPGMGEPSSRDGAAGDLFIRLTIQPPEQVVIPPSSSPYTGYGATDAAQTPPPQPRINLEATYPPPQYSQKRSRRKLWIALSALVVVLLLLLSIGSILAFNNLWASTPTKTLDTFCSDLQSKNYQDAYNQIAVDYQASHSEPNFKTDFSSVTTCTHSSVAVSNGDTISTITLAPDSTYPWTYQLTLVKDSSGNWKIDNFASAPDRTLGLFCSDLQSKNYQDAYNLLTPSFQNKYSQTQFNKYFSSTTSCASTATKLSNSTTTSILTLAPDTTYPWTYQVTLAKDSGGNWKVDDFTAAPDLMLDVFCSDLQSKSYQDAYNLTTLNYQKDVAEPAFQNALSSVTSCSHDFTTNSNSSNFAQVTFGPSSTYLWSYRAVLIKDSSGNWRIDDFNPLPDLTLVAFCSDLGNQDFTDAYSLTSTGYQNNVSEAQFAKNYSIATSCTPSSVSSSNGIVTATITYHLNDGTTAKQIATLIKDNNGDWKIDSFQNV